MKKIILSAFLATAGFSAWAQTNGSNVATTSAPTQVGTNEEIRSLANRLQLNEREYIQLRDLMKARNEQVAEVNSMYSNDPAMRQSKLAAISTEFESNLSRSLSAKQYTAYLESLGRTPAASGAGFEAGGYGGRSLEAGATTTSGGAAPATNTSGTGTDNATGTNNASGTTGSGSGESNSNAGGMHMRVDDDKVKLESGDRTMKVKTRKEKVETEDAEYKADKDEMKMKSKDNQYKAKSEKGKTKIETPSGKMKMEDGKVKMKTKDGKKVTTDE